MNTRQIKVVPYDPAWPTLFTNEAAKIKEAMGENLITIHHIGSTSVPGLDAKPIIDMIPVVRDILAVDKSNEAMAALGYSVKGEYGIPFRRFFSKEAFNVHVFEQGDPEIERHLKFVQYLQDHPDYLKAYATLKIDTAKQHPHDILAYCNAKNALIQEIDENAGTYPARLVQACLDVEREEYHRIYQEQVLAPLGKSATIDDIFLDSPNHIHFVYRLGSKIIGILYLEFIHKKNAQINILALDRPYQTQEHEKALFDFAKKWLRHQGKILIK